MGFGGGGGGGVGAAGGGGAGVAAGAGTGLLQAAAVNPRMAHSAPTSRKRRMRFSSAECVYERVNRAGQSTVAAYGCQVTQALMGGRVSPKSARLRTL